MLTALLSPVEQWWLVGLLATWGFFLFGGFLVGSDDPNRRMPAWTRMASSITLVIAAISWAIISRDTGITVYALLIATGMAFGLIGDLWLAGFLPGGRRVLGGIAAFGVGHIIYIGAFLWLAEHLGFRMSLIGWASLATWWIIAIVGWFIIVYRNREPDVLVWAALAYALLLSTTAGVATTLALQDIRFALLALGAGLFLLSDLVLAGELFGGLSFRYIGDVVWLTYGPAQMLIVYSVGTAMAAVSQTA